MDFTVLFCTLEPSEKAWRNKQRISEATPKEPAPPGGIELNIQEIPDCTVLFPIAIIHL